jgi:hypothetical protein
VSHKMAKKFQDFIKNFFNYGEKEEESEGNINFILNIL